MSAPKTMKIALVEKWIAECQRVSQECIDQGKPLPDFISLDPRKSDMPVDEKHDWPKLSQLPFDTCRCHARMFKAGYAVQCSRVPNTDEDPNSTFCKTHSNQLKKVAPGRTLRFGTYDQPRPDKWLDVEDGNSIAWADQRTKKSSAGNGSRKSKTSLKVGELREYLASRIPNEQLKGLKKPDLEDLYLKEKANEKSPTEENSSPIPEENSSPIPEEMEPEPEMETEEQLHLEPQETVVDDTNRQKLVDEADTQVEKEFIAENDCKIVRHQSQDGKPVEVIIGSGLENTQEPPSQPRSLPDFHRLFEANGIPKEQYEDLKGLRDYKKFWDQYQSRDIDYGSDTDELSEDETNYSEIEYHGVSYLEDENSGKIYDAKKKHLGQWDASFDEIEWNTPEIQAEQEKLRE